MVLEGKIVEVLTGAGVGNAEEILNGALPGRVGDTDNDVNGARANKVVGLMIVGMDGGMEGGIVGGTMPEENVGDTVGGTNSGESVMGVFLSL